MTAEQLKSFSINYDEFCVLVRTLLKERQFHMAQLPGALEVDALTEVPTLQHIDSLLARLGYGAGVDQVDMDDWVLCEQCKGHGLLDDGRWCPNCGCQGYVPPGVTE